jgi:hypothetical protein
MRIEVLSEHPDLMLADIERERRRGAVEQLARVESLRDVRRDHEFHTAKHPRS